MQLKNWLKGRCDMNKGIASWKVRTGGQVKGGAKDIEAGLGKTPSVIVVETLSREGLEICPSGS